MADKAVHDDQGGALRNGHCMAGRAVHGTHVVAWHVQGGGWRAGRGMVYRARHGRIAMRVAAKAGPACQWTGHASLSGRAMQVEVNEPCKLEWMSHAMQA
eukprot:350005-Chlamydomonas_euryale.AAC.2